MGTGKQRGFTIIETLLFLAITGVMMATMIAGTSVSLNNQRYRDAVVSLKTLIQEQYSDIQSTQNDRTASDTCALVSSETTYGAGQSDCEIFGRYMVIKGGDVTIFPVLSYRDAAAKPPSATDIEYMTNASYFKMAVDRSFVATDSLEWGTEISWPASGDGSHSVTTPRSLGVLFVRSPESGQMYTFTSDTVPADLSSFSGNILRDMIVAGATVPGQAARTVCVESNGLSFAGANFIYINAYATGSGSIETRTNDYNVESGVNTRC